MAAVFIFIIQPLFTLRQLENLHLCEDADFSLHDPPAPLGIYIFLILFIAHPIITEREAPHPTNHPSIAHSGTALVFILLFKVTPGF